MSNGRATKRRKLSGSQLEPVQKLTKKFADPGTDVNSAEKSLPSLKNLASSDPKLRRQNLTTVLSYFESCPPAHPLTHTQCLQLWRAFHVALYMHDSKNAVSVQDLTAKLAGTVLLFRQKDLERAKLVPAATSGEGQNEPTKDNYIDASSGWFSIYTVAFWETMAREWSTIDSHRVNKYLLLIRLVTREIFKVCLESRFGAEVTNAGTEDAHPFIQQQMEIFERWPLNAKERKVSDGLRLHMLDIWNDELFNALRVVQEDQQRQATGKKGKGYVDKNKAAQLKHMSDILKEFREPPDKLSKSDSGAQRHVRLKAKELLVELEEKIVDLE